MAVRSRRSCVGDDHPQACRCDGRRSRDDPRCAGRSDISDGTKLLPCMIRFRNEMNHDKEVHERNRASIWWKRQNHAERRTRDGDGAGANMGDRPYRWAATITFRGQFALVVRPRGAYGMRLNRGRDGGALRAGGTERRCAGCFRWRTDRIRPSWDDRWRAG